VPSGGDAGARGGELASGGKETAAKFGAALFDEVLMVDGGERAGSGDRSSKNGLAAAGSGMGSVR
jgi:hypothetical protein